MLGGARLGQKKYSEAEPLLLKGYEGLKQREKTIPAYGTVRIPEALDRLIELYTATNKPDEVEKWRAERANYKESAPPPREKKCLTAISCRRFTTNSAGSRRRSFRRRRRGRHSMRRPSSTKPG